jgi:hypothetical protein
VPATVEREGSRKRLLEQEEHGEAKLARLEQDGEEVWEPGVGECVNEQEKQVLEAPTVMNGDQLARAGLAGLASTAAVARRLEELALHSDEFLTNGLLVELLDTYSPGVQPALTRVLQSMLGIHPGRVTHQLQKRLRQYFNRSTGIFRWKMEAAPEEPWLYLPWLKPGGHLHRPELLLQPTALSAIHPFTRFGRRLAELGEVKARCAHCGQLANMPACSCLAHFYCNMACRRLDVLHTVEECTQWEEEAKEGAVLSVMPSVQVTNLETELVQAGAVVTGLKTRVMRMKTELVQVETVVTGLRTRVMRMKRWMLKKSSSLKKLRRENASLLQRALLRTARTVLGPSQVALTVNPGQQVFKVTPTKVGEGSQLTVLEAVEVKQARELRPVRPEQQEEERAATVEGRGRGEPRDRHRRHVIHRQDRRTMVDLGRGSKPFSQVRCRGCIQCTLKHRTA